MASPNAELPHRQYEEAVAMGVQLSSLPRNPIVTREAMHVVHMKLDDKAYGTAKPNLASIRVIPRLEVLGIKCEPRHAASRWYATRVLRRREDVANSARAITIQHESDFLVRHRVYVLRHLNPSFSHRTKYKSRASADVMFTSRCPACRLRTLCLGRSRAGW